MKKWLPFLVFLTTTHVHAAVGNNEFTAGWASFGQVVPQGKAIDGLQVGALPTQTDVKNRWPDGSIKYAIVTTLIPYDDYFLVDEGPKDGGSFTPTWPQASVTFVTNGQTYKAKLPSFSGDNWLSGSLVNESRVIVTPTSGGVPHPLLQVIFDIRSYVDGGHRVDVTVQNIQDVTAGAPINYDVDIQIDGQSVFSKTGINHGYGRRWRKSFPTGGLVESLVTPDFEPFYFSGAIPRFLPTVANPTPSASGAKFDILQYGDMSSDMASPGGRPEIAPYPYWTAQYLIHKTPEQRTYMLAHADLSGSWSGHMTQTDGITLISLDTYPTYWQDGRSGTHASPLYGETGPNAARIYVNGGAFPGGGWPSIEVAHMPSLTYVPYLITGDRYYLDQMKFWSNYSLLSGHLGRNGGQGILADNQIRGIAWAIRSLADIAAYTPDSDFTQNYFRSKLQNNLNWLDNMAKTTNGGPFDLLFYSSSWGSGGDDRAIIPWMNGYLCWALDHAGQQGFGPVTAMRDRLANIQLRLFNSETEGYPRVNGAPLATSIGRVTTGPLVFFTTMKEIYDATMLKDNRALAFAGNYGPEARLQLQIGAREGMPGAQSALDYLMAQPGMVGDVNWRSGFAVMDTVTYAAVPLPTPPPTPTPAPDTVDPSAPGNLVAIAVSTTEIDLTWEASSDDVGVKGYGILRDGIFIGKTTPGLSFTDTGLLPDHAYIYVVAAYDAAGNATVSNSANAVTFAEPIVLPPSPPIPPVVPPVVPVNPNVTKLQSEINFYQDVITVFSARKDLLQVELDAIK